MKRILSLLLAVIMLCSLACPVLAGSPFMTVENSENLVQFYRRDPDTLTHLQVAALSLMMAGMDVRDFSTSTSLLTDAAAWVKATGILDSSRLNTPATREDAAEIVAKVYQLTPSVNLEGFADTESVWANTFNDYGITVGTRDKYGDTVFNGEAKVKPSDVTGLVCQLNRVVEEPIWGHIEPGTVAETEPGPVTTPRSLEDYVDTIRYMMKNGQRAHTFIFDAPAGDPYTQDEVMDFWETLGDTIDQARWEVKKSDPAYESFYDSCHLRLTTSGYGSISRIKVRISYNLEQNLTEATLLRSIRAYEAEVAESLSELKADGRLRDSMTQREKAEVLFGYVAGRYTYDMAFLGANAYHASGHDRAVCEGYVDFYASLCQALGLEMRAVYSDDHAWNTIEQNGIRYHIDVTWGDQVTWLDTDFFWMTESQLQSLDPGRTVVGGY